MILSIILLFIYMSLVGKAKVEMEIIYRAGFINKPSYIDLFFVEPYYTVKQLLTDMFYYCWVCISEKELDETVSVVVEALKEVDNGKRKDD